jgi:hypothetical protein
MKEGMNEANRLSDLHFVFGVGGVGLAIEGSDGSGVQRLCGFERSVSPLCGPGLDAPESGCRQAPMDPATASVT